MSVTEEEKWDRYYMRRLRQTQKVPELKDNPILAFDIAHDDGLDDDNFEALLEVFKNGE